MKYPTSNIIMLDANKSGFTMESENYVSKINRITLPMGFELPDTVMNLLDRLSDFLGVDIRVLGDIPVVVDSDGDRLSFKATVRAKTSFPITPYMIEDFDKSLGHRAHVVAWPL